MNATRGGSEGKVPRVLNSIHYIHLIEDLSQVIFSLKLDSHIFSINGSTALVDFGHFFSFLIYAQSARLHERGISQSQGRYLHTE
jgi:hypothetical protein